jgi:hypothetical protein
MKRLLFGALVGGAVGASVTFFRGDTQTEEADPATDPFAANGRSPLVTAALAGAAAGAFVGFVLDRRAKRASKLVGYARKARPSVESATLTAVDKLFDAAEYALPVVEHAAIAARGRAADFADTARDRAVHVMN